MSKPTKLDDVRADVRGLAEAMLVLVETLVRSRAIPAAEVEEVLDSMLSTIDPRLHDHWRGSVRDQLDELERDVGRNALAAIAQSSDPSPAALRRTEP